MTERSPPPPSLRERLRRRAEALEALEQQQRAEPLRPYLENLRVFEALYREARALGVLPPSDPLDGIEVDIELARALRRVRRSA